MKTDYLIATVGVQRVDAFVHVPEWLYEELEASDLMSSTYNGSAPTNLDAIEYEIGLDGGVSSRAKKALAKIAKGLTAAKVDGDVYFELVDDDDLNTIGTFDHGQER